MNRKSHGVTVRSFDKEVLFRQTVETQRRLNERAPVFRSAMDLAGFKYDSATAAFQRDNVRVYFSQGQPDIQRRLDLLKAYQRFTIKTTGTAAVYIDDALDAGPAEVIEKVLSAVEQAAAGERRATKN
ncbi:hypothetical protein [Cupriavidus sp. AcVe19-6a]|uniref:hypothetical protein n=1 Tax=Cupriavidus sp. AcVe19-6a TaxID=2821358 RepID=UPI001AEA9200|nr:hypothetical protein [Cupriavidus sp. AcVe19-6a]MBP0639965.1 hypothetical protein [Cupriavidus sp. AcVe19-6a]